MDEIPDGPGPQPATFAIPPHHVGDYPLDAHVPGAYAVTLMPDGTVVVLERGDDVHRFTHRRLDGTEIAPVWSAPGSYVVSKASSAGCHLIYDDSGVHLLRLSDFTVEDLDLPVAWDSSCALDAPGATIAVAGETGGLFRDGVLQPWPGQVTAVGLSPDGSLVVTSDGAQLQVREVSTGNVVFEAEAADPEYLAIDPTNRWLAADTRRRRLNLSALFEAEDITIDTVHAAVPTDDRRNVVIWDLRTGRPAAVCPAPYLSTVKFSPDGTLLAVVGHGSGHLVNLPEGQAVRLVEFKGGGGADLNNEVLVAVDDEDMVVVHLGPPVDDDEVRRMRYSLWMTSLDEPLTKTQRDYAAIGMASDDDGFFAVAVEKYHDLSAAEHPKPDDEAILDRCERFLREADPNLAQEHFDTVGRIYAFVLAFVRYKAFDALMADLPVKAARSLVEHAAWLLPSRPAESALDDATWNDDPVIATKAVTEYVKLCQQRGRVSSATELFIGEIEEYELPEHTQRAYLEEMLLDDLDEDERRTLAQLVASGDITVPVPKSLLPEG